MLLYKFSPSAAEKMAEKKLFLVEYSKIFTCIKNYQLMCYS